MQALKWKWQHTKLQFYLQNYQAKLMYIATVAKIPISEDKLIYVISTVYLLIYSSTENVFKQYFGIK